MLEQAERIPVEQRARVEQWAARLRSTIYDAEDVVDISSMFESKSIGFY